MSAQLRSRFGDEKRVAEKIRSLHAVHDFGGRTRLIDIFGSRSSKRLVQACSRSQMLERGDCERRNSPLPVIDSVICEACYRLFPPFVRHEEA